MNLLEQLLALIAPHRCLRCDFEGYVLCPACAVHLPVIPSRCYRCGVATHDFITCKRCRAASPLSAVWAATAYEGVAKDIIHRLKFERARAAAWDIARDMAAQMPADTAWIVTHAPTATSRVRGRGYDQAALIAKEVARQLSRSYIPLLARTGQQRQVGQTRTARRRQLQKAFVPLRLQQIQSAHILIIDDVLTTGSTLEAAATVLKAAGAKKVTAAVFAVA